MYQPVVLYIALRYVRGRTLDRFSRFVSRLSTFGITLGVMALIIVLSVMNGFEQEMENKVLGLIPQALLTTTKGMLDPKRISVSVPSMLIGVVHVTPLTTGDVVLQSTRSVAAGIMLGVNPSDSEPLSRYLINTCMDDLIANKYRIILGDGLATQLGVKQGDQLRLIVPGANQFTPVGRIPNQRLFTVIGTFSANSEVDNYQLLINQQDASRMMRYPVGYITGWRLWLQHPLAVDQWSTQFLPDNLVWKDWREYKGELFQAMRIEKNMMGLLLSLIITVAAFNIITSLGLLVIEKKIEVAIFQTQGLTRHQVMMVFIIYGASAGVIGTLLGTGIGVLLSSKLNYIMPIIGVILDNVMLPVNIKPLQVLIIAFLAITIALLSTIYPSWRAAVIHPAEALRYE